MGFGINYIHVYIQGM